MSQILTDEDFANAKRDISDIDKAVNTESIVDPRWGGDFKSLPLVSKEAQDTINSWQEAINTIVIDDGVPALAVSTANGSNQQAVNDLGGVDYWAARAYQTNNEVRLTDGTIVFSTIDNNSNNPNSDMTGWKKKNSADQIFDESGLSQQEINNSKTVKSIAALKLAPTGFSVFVESVLDGKNLGSGWFYWDASSSETEDIATVVVSSKSTTGRWKRVSIANPNPTWWGCVGGGADADNFKKAIDWAYAQKKRLTIDSKISLEKQIQIWGTYGWDFEGGGEFVIVSDVTPLKFMSLPRNVAFYKTKVSATVDTALDNAFAEFSVRYHIEGLRFFGFEFIHTTRKWNGLVFTNSDGAGTGGVSGGTMFLGCTGAYLNSLIRFKAGAYNYFVNAATFQACRDSYSNYQVLFEVSAGQLVFSNISSQENLLGTIFATDTGGISRSIFDFVHNWDNNVVAIRLSKNCIGNIVNDVYPNKLVDVGFGNKLSEVAQTLKTATTATWRDETYVKRMKSDFARIFNISNVVGTATITDGIAGASDGTMTPTVNLKCLAASDVALLFAQTDEAYTGGWGVHQRYSRSMFEVEFRLNQIDLDDYAIMIGMAGSTAKLGTMNAFAQGLYLTNVGGNFVIAQHTAWSANLPNTNLTALYTLGALDTKFHSFGLQFSSYQAGSDANQVFHFDEVAVGSFSGTNAGNRSPVIAARSTTGKALTLSIKSATLKHLYNQAWI